MSQMAMTDPERGFLDAVLADPGGDVVRLIMADWLEDHGQPERGEFIRVQIELADMARAGVGKGKSVWKRHADALRRRERELLREGHPHWCNLGQMLGSWAVPLIDHDPASPGQARYRRGFVASVSLTLADFMTHAKAIFGAAPVEEVRLTDRRPALWQPGAGWFGTDALRVGGEHLPLAIYCHLPGVDLARDNRWHWWPTVDAAHSALSRACVAYGRSLALPAKEAVSR